MDINLVPSGTHLARRYLIKAENGTYWTGEEWSPKKAKALVYADHKSAAQDIAGLKVKAEVVIVFEGLVEVEVQSSRNINDEELQQFMADASVLLMDYQTPRPQSLQDAEICSTIHWDTLKRKAK